MKKKSKNKPIIFIQPWGTYCNDTIVCVGGQYKDMVRFLKQLKYCKPEVIQELVASEKDITAAIDKGNYGWFKFMQKSNYSIIWLKKIDDDWSCWEVLMHELHHAVACILGDERAMANEPEALAYQQEYLFRAIRRRLQNIK